MTSVALAESYFQKAREVAFYGDDDFIPTEQYAVGDADAALADCRFVVSLLDAFSR